MGEMLPGNLFTQDGRVLDFAIQKTTGSGGVTAFDSARQENFSGTYVAVLEATGAVSNGFATNGQRFVAGSGSAVVGSNMADATAFLRGNKGTMIQCSMKIQAAAYPHGLGTCTDNHGGQYRLQF